MINRAHPSLKRRIRGVVQADVSPVSMLEVFAHLAQGDIPLLSAHARIAYMQTAALQSQITAYITKMARSFGNQAILKQAEFASKRCPLCQMRAHCKGKSRCVSRPSLLSIPDMLLYILTGAGFVYNLERTLFAQVRLPDNRLYWGG